MSSRLLLNLLLLIFVLSLITIMRLVSNQPSDATSLLALDRDAVNRITIKRPQNDIILEKQGSDWIMRAPHHTRAHAFRINRLLDLTEVTDDNSYDINGLHLASYGLAPPRAEILFNDHLIQFGGSNPVNHKRYIRSQDRLFLINDSLYPLISSQPTSFVDLSLLAKTDRIQKLILPELTLSKDPQQYWKTENTKHTYSADQAQTLIQYWQSAQAFGVHAFMPRKHLGDISIHLESGNVIHLQISDDTPWLILANTALGIEYHFDGKLIQQLLPASGNLSDTP